jgi:hypothetical protein
LFRREAAMEAASHIVENHPFHDWVLAACVGMQGDMVSVPDALVWRQRTMPASMPRPAAEYVRSIAHSCSACRVRLGLDKPPKKEVTRQAAPVVTKKCCGK